MRALRSWFIVLLFVWAALYLPNLRTNPNWYGDEGEWMDMSWSYIHGHPVVGPVVDDFVFPYSYPPLYQLISGALLWLFGNDIVVGRALNVVTALAAAGVLFWIGTRLRDKAFGLLCAAVFLVYPQTVMNFRWVRSHPMAGTLALVTVGFLVRYLQEKRLRDIALAGLFCSLAAATHYYAVGLIPAVIIAAVWVNWRRWRERMAWRDVLVGAATAGGYGILFVVWYVATQGGVGHLVEQVHRLSGMTQPPSLAEVGLRIGKFCFTTPTHIGSHGFEGHDFWLMAAAVGLVAFPVARWRGWLVFWALLLMQPVFRKQDNVSWFFYPAMIFLPLMALGVAGILEQAGRLLAWAFHRKGSPAVRVLPGAAACLIWGIVSLQGSLVHFETMIDRFTQRSVTEAEAAMTYVNSHTTAEDFVLVPKQIYWLVKNAKKSMLSHCQTYEGKTNAAWPTPIPRELFWFDCRWQNAKYVVLASGADSKTQQPQGIDAVYTLGAGGASEVVPLMIAQGWKPVYVGGQGMTMANVGPDKLWPLAINGEYLVLENPRLIK
jgi:4-amino-4-deoxy-L-arabinose transferase-like glycosyltransferase